jgi:quinol monooxygenase YgiN
MAFHFLIRFEPPSENVSEFREQLLLVVGPTRAEKGCLSIRVLESVRETRVFAIHSEWVDEAAFDLHAKMPYTLRFVDAAEKLTGQPVKGLRSREIGELDSHIFNFEKVLAAKTEDSPIARAIREIYATRYASVLLAEVRRIFTHADITYIAEPRAGMGPLLPSLANVKAVGPRLIEAAYSRDAEAAVEALVDMGVFGLCPSTDQDFSRLEWSVMSIAGRVRLIPLVELSILAAELGFYGKAEQYVAGSRKLSPAQPHLHDLHTVEGLVALSRGDTAAASQSLLASIPVCKGGISRVKCCEHGQNFMLAARLLEQGHGDVVVKYLKRAGDVWYLDEQIKGWIESITAGEKPELSPNCMLFGEPERTMWHRTLEGRSFPETPVDLDDPVRLARLRRLMESYRERN